MIELLILVVLFIALYLMLPNSFAIHTVGLATFIEEEDDEED